MRTAVVPPIVSAARGSMPCLLALHVQSHVKPSLWPDKRPCSDSFSPSTAGSKPNTAFHAAPAPEFWPLPHLSPRQASSIASRVVLSSGWSHWLLALARLRQRLQIVEHVPWLAVQLVVPIANKRSPTWSKRRRQPMHCPPVRLRVVDHLIAPQPYFSVQSNPVNPLEPHTKKNKRRSCTLKRRSCTLRD